MMVHPEIDHESSDIMNGSVSQWILIRMALLKVMKCTYMIGHSGSMCLWDTFLETIYCSALSSMGPFCPFWATTM